MRRNSQPRPACSGWRAEKGRRNRRDLPAVPAPRLDSSCSAILEPPDELEAGPRLVDCANLHIDETRGETELTNEILRDIGLDLGCFLRPRDPEHAVGF